MNIKAAAQAIRDTVSMDQVLGLYGYQAKHGFMCCPFHGEKKPSLKIYPETGGWHCFGCGRGGSVIDFVIEQECCDFRTAVTGIDGALKLGLMDPHENPMEARKEMRIQDALDKFVDAIFAYCEVLLKVIEREQKTRLDMVKLLEEKRDTDKQSVTADEWTAITAWKDQDEYDEFRKDMIREFEEVVSAWRRKARKAT